MQPVSSVLLAGVTLEQQGVREERRPILMSERGERVTLFSVPGVGCIAVPICLNKR